MDEVYTKKKVNMIALNFYNLKQYLDATEAEYEAGLKGAGASGDTEGMEATKEPFIDGFHPQVVEVDPFATTLAVEEQSPLNAATEAGIEPFIGIPLHMVSVAFLLPLSLELKMTILLHVVHFDRYVLLRCL